MNSTTVRALLVRGMLAGIVAGLLAFALAYLIGEPPVNAAIALEAAHSEAAHHAAEEPELVSRAVQSTLGLGSALLVFGTAIGGIAALVFCVLLGRLGRLSLRATAALLALAAFVTVYLVPWIKYPPNPPAVGNPDTIGKRTILYFGMIVLSVLIGLAAVLLGRRLAPRWGNWNATIAAAVVFVVATTVAMALLPVVNEVPEDFPATVLWQFRLASLAIQALLWTVFGLLFGYLAERVLQPSTTAADTSSPVPAVSH